MLISTSAYWPLPPQMRILRGLAVWPCHRLRNVYLVDVSAGLDIDFDRAEREALILAIERRMKNLERIALLTLTTAYAGYFIQQILRTHAERLFRLAAGESPYERTHPKPLRIKKS
ncbi:MAG: hypothetical protein WCP45_03645 [Verrucomicrobiota bacterium]